MTGTSLSPHDTMEISELMKFKSVCLNKTNLIMGSVSDPGLKALLKKDVQQSQKAVNDLQTLLNNTPPLQ